MEGKSGAARAMAGKREQLDCMLIASVILPAVRASVSDRLADMGYGQKSIAELLGIAQAAVSKYRKKKYSTEVGAVKRHIEDYGLCDGIIGSIAGKKDKEIIEKNINNLCEKLIGYYNP